MEKIILHQLGTQVELISGEKGVVIARAEYLESDTQYQVRYIAADGRLTECWWSVDAIKPVAEAVKAAA